MLLGGLLLLGILELDEWTKQMIAEGAVRPGSFCHHGASVSRAAFVTNCSASGENMTVTHGDVGI